MQKLLIPALLFALMAVVGCSKSDDDQKLVNDSWFVSYYLESDDKIEDTGLFSGYTFEFNDNNEWIIYFPGGSSQTGKWDIDNAANTVSFALDNPSAPMDGILGEWELVAQLDNGLSLKRKDASTNVFDEYSELTFTKQ
ncbi:MAG: hypothetical protein KDC61_06975 [Saprospiraceae bacterium]|nr:hypothetical protein [Saprospiraceae bacterium]MCB0544941.1 hypothetical protein [Saprospiraceae bacterium]MCB0574291.1 hypothetical protein [Saprospiraceae bacterium]MCB9307676.1 hypothetical protein [Lewinellaceae bacterium]MCB9353944.1 hypothetical protein [Lewinellaceae bacterium]